ncbi:hypothetical protein [Flexivirga oryzae]|uniref:Uncharacterized protein n=1 Tax=Flexivirga oryzae TaxID=1794944 RepID=A0A839NF47_9MICO|nr:hypothetical protein [Flexivirga oryzae]MBB2894246.1 hypothetical protein [Flexivirga oryzae]
MIDELEEQLRAAYADLPSDAHGAADLAEHAISAGRQRKHLRVAAGASGGLVAATAIVATVALTGNAVGNGANSVHRVDPAGPGVHLQFSTQNPTRHPAPRKATSSPSITTVQPGYDDYSGPDDTSTSDPYQGHNKKIAGLAGYLLPHGAQLPKGLTYSRHRPTSNVDADDLGAAPVPTLVMARSNAQNDSTPDTTGQVANVFDSAFNYRTDGSMPGDGNPDQRSLMTLIVAFKNVHLARTAIPTVQASRGGWIWVAGQTGAVQVPWSGVAGADGPSYLFEQPSTGVPSQPDLKFKSNYIAVQVVGKYVISAMTQSEQGASTAISSIITNLQKANLL